MNDEAVHELVKQLNSLEVGELPAELFYAISRLMVLCAVEVVPLRMANGTCEVLLTQRPPTDPYWPNQWHNPGSIMRGYDTKDGFADAIRRVCAGELGLTEWSMPTFVAPYFWKGARGKNVSLVHWLDVTHTEVREGAYYPIDRLPDNIIDGMGPVITMAVQHFRETHE